MIVIWHQHTVYVKFVSMLQNVGAIFTVSCKDSDKRAKNRANE